MLEPYYIGAYWGVRKESVEECAQRIIDFLICLAQCDSSFAHWFETADSREEALKHEIKPDPARLQRLLLAGRNRTDFGHKVIEQLGYRISLWNGEGEDTESIGLSVHCGSYAPRPGVNSCVIDLPRQGIIADRLLHVHKLKAIMQCMVTAWNPDWAVVNSNSYQKITPFPSSNAPRMGWILYLSYRRGVVPPLPSPSNVVPLGTQGTLVITTEERFTASNPQHIETAIQVANILAQAGLLGPLT